MYQAPRPLIGYNITTMVTAGLTGNIGMGKSMVLGLFRELGAATLDSDNIVSGLLDMPQVLEKIKAVLGPDVIDPASGVLDRKKVASIIFSDEDKRRQYEAILHPMVYDQIKATLANSSVEIAVVEVPLLFETGHETDFNTTVTVYSDVGLAIDRMEEAGMTRAEAAERMMAQMPIAEKVSRSGFSVDNNGDMSMTSVQVRRIMKVLKLMASEG
jgi:dephospho-CoA kinase